MNTPETRLASKLMEEIDEKLRVNDYAAVQALTAAYHNLCLAYEVRVRTDNQVKPNRQ